MKNNKKINEVKKEMENLKKDFDKNYKSLETKLKKLEKGTYEVGDEVKWCGLDWYVIKIDDASNLKISSESIGLSVQQYVTLMLKNKMNAEQLNACGFIHDSYNDIIFSDDETCNDWKKSNVRKCVQAFAEKYLDKSKLVIMRTNYDEDKYSEDYIRIPTIRNIEKLPKELRKVNADSGYWTMTASYGTTDTDSYASVFRVSTHVSLSWDYVYNTCGVRPVIKLKAEELG